MTLPQPGAGPTGWKKAHHPVRHSDWSARRRSITELETDAGYEWHDRELYIMRAYYGGAGHFVNVTELVRSMKRDGSVFVIVDNRSMGATPIPRRTKCCACSTGMTANARRS
jgi:hypothetical protein